MITSKITIFRVKGTGEAHKTREWFGPMWRNSITTLRWAGWAEAVSFIVLVAVAMPLKYIWGRPEAVQAFGSIHGFLFVVFCVALIRAMRSQRWPISRGAFVFVAALIPFGPFLIDRRLKEFEQRSGCEG